MRKTCQNCGRPFDEPESEPFVTGPCCRKPDLVDRSPQRYERTDQAIHLSLKDVRRLTKKGKR